VPVLHFFQCLVRDFVHPRIVANQVRQEAVGHNAHQIRRATVAAEVLQELGRASSSSLTSAGGLFNGKTGSESPL
jgi:hypothetical protein